MKAVTEAYEERLWEELNSLLVQVVPEGASAEDAERGIMLALIGHDAEIADLYSASGGWREPNADTSMSGCRRTIPSRSASGGFERKPHHELADFSLSQ